MSQEDIDMILRDLHLQRRNIGKELKYVLDNGLIKTEIENERERLEPLVDGFVKKNNNCLNALGESEENNDDLIDDLKTFVEYIELKWQWFLTLVKEIDEKTQDTAESISIDERDLEVEK